MRLFNGVLPRLNPSSFCCNSQFSALALLALFLGILGRLGRQLKSFWVCHVLRFDIEVGRIIAYLHCLELWKGRKFDVDKGIEREVDEFEHAWYDISNKESLKWAHGRALVGIGQSKSRCEPLSDPQPPLPYPQLISKSLPFCL
jgi:hypothetical protein